MADVSFSGRFPESPLGFDWWLVFLVFGVFCGRNTRDASRARVGQQAADLHMSYFLGEPILLSLQNWVGPENPEGAESGARLGHALSQFFSGRAAFAHWDRPRRGRENDPAWRQSQLCLASRLSQEVMVQRDEARARLPLFGLSPCCLLRLAFSALALRSGAVPCCFFLRRQ